MSDIREEARAEAERRWPEDTDIDWPELRNEFVAGAVWADARKVEVTELIGLLATYGEYVEVDTAIQHVREWAAALGGEQ